MFAVALWARRAIGHGFNDVLSLPKRQKQLPKPMRIRLYTSISIVMLIALLAGIIVEGMIPKRPGAPKVPNYPQAAVSMNQPMPS